jgi:hypothetical protein
MRRLARACWVFVCATVPLSCGGSGGGGGGAPYVFTPALFAGAYHAVLLAGDGTATEIGQTSWGTMTADGASVLATGAMTENRNRVVSSAGPSFPYPFTLTSAGELSVFSVSTEAARGGLAREGLAATLGSVIVPVTQSTALFLLRKGSGLSQATLSGAYHFGYLAPDPVGTLHQGAVGTGSFNGLGAGVFTATTINDDGTLSGPGSGLLMTYTVAPDGTLTIAGPLGFAGGVLAGGELAIVGGNPANGAPPNACIFLRESVGASAATMTGTYSMAGLMFNVFSGDYEAITGTFTADGTGNYGFEATVHSAGALSTIGPTGGTYSVAANGRLVVDAGFTLEGAVASNGAFAFLGGATSAGSSPGLFFLVRR